VKTGDLASSLFWLLLSAFVCVESLRLGVGTLRAPGMGLMPFGASVLLGLFSLALLFRTIAGRESASLRPAPSGALWRGVVPVLIALVLYARLMPVVGYLLSTFLLMSFLSLIVKRQKVWQVVVFSLAATIVTYYVFSRWLDAQFPQGLFGL
jgi:putative tricarboxylic transport membrane protein